MRALKKARKLIENKSGKTLYLNSGDWVENLTALEYHNKRWKLFKYSESDIPKLESEEIDLFEMETILSQTYPI